MVIDTSAVVAIVTDETQARHLGALIEQAQIRRMSSGSVLEATMVLEGRRGDAARVLLETFLRRARIEVVAFDDEQLIAAQTAFRRYGKGRHPAALNFGDCFSYALAQTTEDSLLFTGDDFSQTDIRAADSAG